MLLLVAAILVLAARSTFAEGLLERALVLVAASLLVTAHWLNLRGRRRTEMAAMADTFSA
jgi:hypothetical protein